MLFNSLQFLIFFPVVTVLFYLLPQRFRWVMLLGASSIFYMAFIPSYILILFFTIVIDYFMAIAIEKAVGKRRKIYLLISILANVGVLAFFKYYNFFIDNIDGLAKLIGWNYSLPMLSIILPIGLSFHTFQAMSYTIEVYEENQPAERHFGIYALYVMFYPQLVAGPIERPQNLLHQFREEHHFDYQRVTEGLKLMAWGMFKKVVIADRVAVLVNSVYKNPFNTPVDYQSFVLALATVFFAIQVYCDFSGYTDIARGAAQVMGFKLMKNFDRPYFSDSITEFWKRWHISLTTWFRDYLFLYLSRFGKRTSLIQQSFNLLVVFVISGLWHGASWTFILWGTIHGLFLITSLFTKKFRKRIVDILKLESMPALYKLFRIAFTFMLVCYADIFFRANTVEDAFYVANTIIVDVFMKFPYQVNIRDLWMTSASLGLGSMELAIALITIAILFVVEILQSHTEIEKTLSGKPIWLRWAIYYLLIIATIFLGRFESQQFIYFQF